MCDVADEACAFFIAGNNDTRKACAAERDRFAFDPLRIGNCYLIGTRDRGIELTHREDSLIAISSSDDNIFAVKIILGGGIDVDTDIIQQIPEQYTEELALISRLARNEVIPDGRRRPEGLKSFKIK